MVFVNACVWVAGASVFAAYAVAMGSGGSMPVPVRVGLAIGGCSLLTRGVLMFLDFHGLLSIMREREHRGIDYPPALRQATRRGATIWSLGGAMLLLIALIGPS